MLDGSDSDSETPSISLPSLPVSLQQKSGLTKSISVTSMKEFDQKLNDLRTENFDLKLRLYFAQKGKNGVTNPGKSCNLQIALICLQIYILYHDNCQLFSQQDWSKW